ncbi:MAG TPA: hypothetical protein VFQ54_04170, partial [Thermomicrobiales bacterium]|nr:hypothetical protein [Thermomicrobiales bacterium]
MHATRLLSRWGLVLALLFATFGQIAALGSTSAAAATQAEDPYPGPSSTPKVRDTACPFSDADIPSDIAARGNLACGTVDVPEDHANPDGKSISVFIVQIPSISKKPNSSPLFVLAGGPGQGSSGQLGQFSKTVQDPIASWYPFLKDHNVVLIDQRGTGYSDPNLVCPADLPATPGATPVS